jgi:site-specific DNA-cytosine methylase
VDTFHFTVKVIGRYLPKIFVLENVDGVNHRGSEDKDSPLTWMLGHLKNIKIAGGKQAYTIETESGIGGRAAGVCQDRPRTLIFGVRSTEETTAAAVAKIFKKFLKAYGEEGPTTKIQDFLDKIGSVSSTEAGDLQEASLDDHIAYLGEFKKALHHLKIPERFPPPADQRLSTRVVGTPRVKATIDAVGLTISDCPTDFPVADVSQRADRVHVRTDGTIPTVLTNSNIFCFKMDPKTDPSGSKNGVFVTPGTIARSMGYPGVRFTHVPVSTQRRLVGNGYLVPVSACAMAAACTVTGHVKVV